jgi:hypothetical protein
LVENWVLWFFNIGCFQSNILDYEFEKLTRVNIVFVFCFLLIFFLAFFMFFFLPVYLDLMTWGVSYMLVCLFLFFFLCFTYFLFSFSTDFLFYQVNQGWLAFHSPSYMLVILIRIDSSYFFLFFIFYLISSSCI